VQRKQQNSDLILTISQKPFNKINQEEPYKMFHKQMKGSVQKPHKCSMCSFGKTRLKFARFTWRLLQILGLPT